LSQFVSLPNGMVVDLTGISVDFGVPVCTGAQTAPGAVLYCRPQPGSPIVLQQDVNGVTAIFNMVGVGHLAGSNDNLLPVIGKISFNFTSGSQATIAGLLADFYQDGFIETSFSANFSTGTAVTTTPEPNAVLLVLLGGLVVSAASRRYFGSSLSRN